VRRHKEHAVLLVCLAAGLSPTGASALTAPRPASLSSMERAWRHRLAQSIPGNPRVSLARATSLDQRLRAAVAASGGRILRLVVHRGQEPAPELVIGSSEPAGYLKHRLPGVLRRMDGSKSIYLALVDGHAVRVLEWAINSGSGGTSRGALYVRPGLKGCSPIDAFGWSSPSPPCPSR
jgi:hypothetical protein